MASHPCGAFLFWGIDMLQAKEVIAFPQATVASFRDKAFRSRTVVFPDGDTAMVEKSLVTLSDPGHVTFLDRHADFERVDGSA